MEINFSKYQGTGNDFVMLNNIRGEYSNLTLKQIEILCDRKFGVGADGLIKINASNGFAFEMDYYNSDGSQSFCGNGARCSVLFAESLGVDISKVDFTAIDGNHEASKIATVSGKFISLKMNDVKEINSINADFELNTGSPHYIRFVENLLEIDVFEEGRKIRYSQAYNELGINVNFVEVLTEIDCENHQIEVATYERGVENETLSCGTGVTAAALAFAKKYNLMGANEVVVHTKGGKLTVKFNQIFNDYFENIFLIGPAIHVFDGTIII